MNILRYDVGILKWNKNDLEQIDRKTRQVMTINKELHPRNNIVRIYVSRKRGGRSLQSFENGVKGEEKNLSWFIKNRREILLRKDGGTSLFNTEEAVEPTEYKRTKNLEMEDAWKQKVMH